MEYKAYVARIKNLRKHPNADRLQLGECFGNTVCVSLDYEDNQLGIYFPTDGQLSVAFAEANNLLRKKDADGNNIGGYMDPDKRNVTTIRLRGEKSDGLFLPLTCLETFGNISTLAEGDTISVFNGHQICTKYIPVRQNKSAANIEKTRNKKAVRVRRADLAPLFVEHADTEQLAYNLAAFKPGDQLEVTLKMHGTSQRTGYLPKFVRFKRTLLDKIFNRDGTPIYEWGYVTGTRRTVLEDFNGGFYGSNEFRLPHSKFFEGKLWKGEEVYYEVVGFTTNGTPIMGSVDNKKLNDKAFTKVYGNVTTFSYGCSPDGVDAATGAVMPQSDFYVYRMTMTNEDGQVVEYTPDFMRYRCEQMGCKCVPLLWKGYIPEKETIESAGADAQSEQLIDPAEFVLRLAEHYYDGADPVGKTHVREGVVVRIVNKPKFCAYKHKNFAFKCLEGLVKAEADAPDMEEAQEVQTDN